MKENEITGKFYENDEVPLIRIILSSEIVAVALHLGWHEGLLFDRTYFIGYLCLAKYTKN